MHNFWHLRSQKSPWKSVRWSWIGIPGHQLASAVGVPAIVGQPGLIRSDKHCRSPALLLLCREVAEATAFYSVFLYLFIGFWNTRVPVGKSIRTIRVPCLVAWPAGTMMLWPGKPRCLQVLPSNRSRNQYQHRRRSCWRRLAMTGMLCSADHSNSINSQCIEMCHESYESTSI